MKGLNQSARNIPLFYIQNLELLKLHAPMRHIPAHLGESAPQLGLTPGLTGTAPGGAMNGGWPME